MKTQTIGIIGLNRYGASIGLALKQSLRNVTVMGHDGDGQIMKQAKEMGAVDETKRRASAVASAADILILCEPLSQMELLIMSIAPDVQAHAVVLDTAVLKKPIHNWIKTYFTQGHYVSCMPIIATAQTQDTRLGIAAASPDLFRNSTFCLFPGPEVDEQAVQTAATFGQLLGSQPFHMDISEYDVYMQALETLPALVSTAVFRALTKRTGWRDMSRVAGLPFAQLTSLIQREEEIAHMALADKQATLFWLDTLMAEMADLRRWVAEGDEETLAALMLEMGIQREEWHHQRQANDWTPPAQVQKSGLMGQLFGTFLSRGDKDGKNRKP